MTRFELAASHPKKGAKSPKIAKFEPYRGKIRELGTGGIYEINDHLFEGRYTPTNAHGKREAHNVYAKTREECEKLLEQMIVEVRAKIKADKERLETETEEFVICTAIEKVL